MFQSSLIYKLATVHCAKLWQISLICYRHSGWALLRWRLLVQKSWISYHLNDSLGRVAQSVYRLATGWTVRGSNPGGGEIFRTCPDWPWSPPTLLYNGYRVFPGGKERPGRDADPSPLLVPRSWKGRAIPLLTLRAVRPVQSLSACKRVTFTFTLPNIRRTHLTNMLNLQ